MAWDLAGIPVIIVGGVLLHFCFDRSGRRRVLAVFAPVNESVWEHLKMVYWPLLMLTGVQHLAGAGEPGLSGGRAAGFLTAAALMLALYFVSVAAQPAMGLRSRLATDAAIFVAAVTAGQLVGRVVTPRCDGGALAVVFLLLPVAVFAVTTFAPPRRGIFRDQITGGYGI